VDELDDAMTEDESGAEELDCNVPLELETTGTELEDAPTEDENELEDWTAEEELNR
jgi:hypothetical protein